MSSMADQTSGNAVTRFVPFKYEVWGLIANYGEKLADPNTSMQDTRTIIARLQELAKHI